MNATPNQPRPIIANPHFRAALGTMSRLIVGAWVILSALATIWGLYGYSFTHPGARLPSILGAIGAIAVLLGTSWAGVRIAATQHMDTMMAWIAGGFLLRVLVVAGAVIAAGYWGFDQRFVASAIIAAVLSGMLIEVITLKRARITTVDPKR